MSAFANQKERLAFIERQIAGGQWLFSGPEERAIIRELAAAVKELQADFTKFTKRFEEGEG